MAIAAPTRTVYGDLAPLSPYIYPTKPTVYTAPAPTAPAPTPIAPPPPTSTIAPAPALVPKTGGTCSTCSTSEPSSISSPVSSPTVSSSPAGYPSGAIPIGGAGYITPQKSEVGKVASLAVASLVSSGASTPAPVVEVNTLPVGSPRGPEELLVWLNENGSLLLVLLLLVGLWAASKGSGGHSW